jgi:hypothetical protein
MAELSALDLDCLEYQTGFLSGLILASWGEPEQMHLYASRLASTMDLLGRQRERDYYSLIAETAAKSIGVAAAKAWPKRSLRARITGPSRQQWTDAYTSSLFIEAEDRLRGLDDDTADYRSVVAPYFAAA